MIEEHDHEYRTGIGTDIHRVVEGRKLILGGVLVPFPAGLIGHSDGDVVLHAVADALLGAAGLPDLGELFPDTDPAFKDADSKKLLLEVVAKVNDAGYRPNNIDVIIHAEKPRLSEYKRAMATSIAGLVDLPPTAVGVKAKTNEGLGVIGRMEGIACTAIASIVKPIA